MTPALEAPLTTETTVVTMYKRVSREVCMMIFFVLINNFFCSQNKNKRKQQKKRIEEKEKWGKERE